MKLRKITTLSDLITFTDCPLCGYHYGDKGGRRWLMMVEPRLEVLAVKTGPDSIHGTGFTICPRCGLVHQVAYPDPEKLHNVYASPLYEKTVKHRNNPRTPVGRSASFNEGWRGVHLMDLSGTGLITQHIPDADSILDVGCSRSLLLQAMDQYYGPLSIAGIDPNILSQQVGEALGYKIWSDVADIPEDMKYDLITSIHCLEHIIFPKEHLLKIRDLLTEDGRLFLLLPNVYSPSSLNFFHIFGYSVRTLRYMLELCGFEVEELRTLPAMWMRWFPQDILCVAKKSDHLTRKLEFRPEPFFEFRRRLMGWWYKGIMKLPEWVREPRPPKIVVPVYLLK